MATDFNTDPYNIKNYNVNITERHKIVSCFYLRKAVGFYYRREIAESNNLLDLARRISPNFYACNIVSAFMNSTTNPQKSIEEYNIALENE